MTVFSRWSVWGVVALMVLVLSPEISLQGTVRDDYVEGHLNGGGPLIRARTGDGTIRFELGQH